MEKREWFLNVEDAERNSSEKGLKAPARFIRFARNAVKRF